MGCRKTFDFMRLGSFRIFFILLLLAGFTVLGEEDGTSFLSSISTAPSFGYRVVRHYPHDTQAFTQGLLYDDGHLFESTGQYGASSLRRVELETGKVVQIFHLPSQYFGEGLLLWEGQLVQLTWTSGVGFIYDKSSFKLQDQFRYTIEGWGITSDGQQWILSDGTNLLYFMNPKDHKITKWLEIKDGATPIRNLNELEFIQGEIFANIWQEDRIARIHPESGQVVGWLHMGDLLTPAERSKADVLNGIAYDKMQNRLFITGKYWPRVFEIQLVLPGKASRIRR